MGELIDTFFVTLQVNRKWKGWWLILQYSTLKLKLSILVIEKISQILGNSDPQRNAIQTAKMKRCTVLRSEARFRQACSCIWKSNSSFLSAKGIAQGFSQQSHWNNFLFSLLKKVMVLGLGKQTQHGENLTKRKQGWIMIQFLSDYLDIKLQTHLRKQEVMQTQSLHSENTTVIPELLRGKIT